MNPILVKTYVAGGVIAPYSIAKVGAAAGQALQAAANTDKLLWLVGMLGAASGARVDVCHLGIGEVKLGGTVVFGDKITADEDGAGIALTDQALAAGACESVGTALSAGAAGDIIPVLIQLQRISA